MRRKNKSLYLILIVVILFGISIGYAAISRTLNITGNSEVKQNTWDIHFENVQITEGSVTADTVPVANENNLTIEFSINLDLPGDFYEFTVDVKNSGSIDAMIDSISKIPTLTTAQAKYLNYIIEYQNGEEITSKQLVKSGKSVRLKVRVEYRKDLNAEDLPTTSETLNLGLTVNYVQADSNGIIVKDNGEVKLINVVSGDGTQKSNEVCIGEECFYVMYSDDDSITMLAKYNLEIGNVCTSSKACTPIENLSGIQDATMIGYPSDGGYPRNGTIVFSNTEYWVNNRSLKAEYGTSFPAYVYDSNSTLYNYVENYKTYLSTLGVTPIEARLITKEELEGLGCSGSWCNSAPSWVYATSYWSGTAYSSLLHSVWGVYSASSVSDLDYSKNYHFGCRPVIVIPKSLIVGTDSGNTKKIIEFTFDGNTYQAEEGMTWAEWVTSDYNTKNLNIDGNCYYIVGKNGNVDDDELVENYNYEKGRSSTCGGGSN